MTFLLFFFLISRMVMAVGSIAITGYIRHEDEASAPRTPEVHNGFGIIN